MLDAPSAGRVHEPPALVIGSRNGSSRPLRPWLPPRASGAAFEGMRPVLEAPDVAGQASRQSFTGQLPALREWRQAAEPEDGHVAATGVLWRPA
ncbi:hypothetical protein [Stenotrophomonas mori]|uniref:Uncharacterized protein n=1 Tax=Stenotrophomonas mori TaxID=2871096 RepID=A0ABT0SIF8_9GAMM|nr:hypothetical protein [Stenotrophomonas mori]MCL7715122.1 hypothetical protein [Stenotrophomonas mori]